MNFTQNVEHMGYRVQLLDRSCLHNETGHDSYALTVRRHSAQCFGSDQQSKRHRQPDSNTGSAISNYQLLPKPLRSPAWLPTGGIRSQSLSAPTPGGRGAETSEQGRAGWTAGSRKQIKPGKTGSSSGQAIFRHPGEKRQKCRIYLSRHDNCR